MLVLTLAVLEALLKITLIDVSLRFDQFSFTMGKAVHERTCVHITIRKDLFSFALEMTVDKSSLLRAPIR